MFTTFLSVVTVMKISDTELDWEDSGFGHQIFLSMLQDCSKYKIGKTWVMLF